MKHKKLFLIIFGISCSLCITNLAFMQSSSISRLVLDVDSPKRVYKLGQPIDFSFELRNEGDKTITILDIFGTETGQLHLKTSQNDKNFVGSDDPDWGLLDMSGVTILKPSENVKTSGTVLWNLSSQEVTRFRFDKSGTYYFKAYYTALIEREKFPIKLESEPIQITIEKPTGEDLEVWNKIKDKDGFSYFIQKGEVRIPSYKPEERASFLQEIQQIIIQHPNSFYAESLRESLDKFKTAEAKRQEFKQKLHQQ